MAGAPASEAQVQRLIRDYLAACGIDAIHIPNGAVLAGDRVARVKQSNALKRAGVMPGAADLLLLDRRQPRAGFVEVKREGARASPAQLAFADLCARVWRLPYALCRSADDMRAALADWGWRA